jgi:hypothetical protein
MTFRRAGLVDHGNIREQGLRRPVQDAFFPRESGGTFSFGKVGGRRVHIFSSSTKETWAWRILVSGEFCTAVDSWALLDMT